MWNPLFTVCVACGDASPRGATHLYCEKHDHLARKAMARIAWGGGVLPRLVFLIFLLGILIATAL